MVVGCEKKRESESITVTKCPLFFHFFFFFSIYYCYVKLDYRRRRKKNWTECSNNHGHWPTVNCMNNSCSIIISFTEFSPSPPKKNWIYQPNQTDQLANILCVCVCVSANTRMMTISIEFNFNSNSFPLHTHTHTANSFCDCYHTHTLFYSLKKMRTKKNFLPFRSTSNWRILDRWPAQTAAAAASLIRTLKGLCVFFWSLDLDFFSFNVVVVVVKFVLKVVILFSFFLFSCLNETKKKLRKIQIPRSCFFLFHFFLLLNLRSMVHWTFIDLLAV